MNIYQIANQMKINHQTIYDINIRVAYYVRVSTLREQQDSSVDNQIIHFEKLIKSHPNWTFVNGYVDRVRGESASNRESFMQMIEDGKSDKFDLLLTKEVSRFARNTIDSLTYTRELLRYGVGVLFENDNICTIDTDAEFRLTIMASIAQDEVRKLSERVKFGQKQSISKGIVMGNSRIYGYDKNNGKLVINKPEAEMIQLIFNMYATGKYALRAIERELWDRGYRSRSGNRIHHNTIGAIINNPKYKGYYCGNKVKIVWYDSNGGTEVKQGELEKLKFELEQAENDYDLERAAILRHGEIPKKEKEIAALKNSNQNRLLSDTVTDQDICKIIGKWTNIPVTKLLESEKEKILHLESDMAKRVMGQDEALKLVSEAIMKSRSGIKDPNRPIASFMFLGPTRTLAYELFDDERHMIRIDMSEYMEKFSVSRLIGSPPGYVGYEEGGQLTEAVRRNPYSIVLFDEIEKAHPEVLNLLLQILDDGRVTDSNGRTVDFKNTIIIMTSNLGSEHVLENNKQEVINELKREFRPEFINRIDEIVVFNALTKEAINQILDKIIKDLENRLIDHHIKIQITDEARKKFIEEGYDINFGARPLKRLVGKTIEVDLSKLIIEGKLHEYDTVIVDYNDDNFIVKIDK